MIEKIYCISLKDNNIRRNLMTQQLEKFYKGYYKIINAVTSDNSKVIDTFNNLTLKSSNIEALSQIAICYSHLKCLKKIYKKKLIYGAIIEDDIRIKPNINEKIYEYLNNTPKLNEIMNSEPCIIHICGPYNYIQNANKFKERRDEIIINICFYIVNYKMAEILINNFYPIKWQFDTYISKICREKNIKEFTACPILAWDLSSTLYSKFWTKDDNLIRQSLFSTSKIKKINKLEMKPNIFIDIEENSFRHFIFNKILQTSKRNIISNQNKLHYLPFYSSFSNLNTNTIISGQGIYNFDEKINVPFCTLFVRGPLTRNKFLETNIFCPELYIDPLILYSKIDTKSIFKNLTSINKYIILLDYDINTKNISNNIKIINVQNYSFTQILIDIKGYEIVISNIYEILVISTTFKKITIPINNLNENFDIRFLDYLLGYKSIINNWSIKQLNYLNINEIINTISSNNKITYPQINFNEIVYKQEKLNKLISFL